MLGFSATFARPALSGVPLSLSVPVRNLSRSRSNKRGKATLCSAGGTHEDVVDGPFAGAYGEWSLTKSDVKGVNIYRSALVMMALASTVGTIFRESPSVVDGAYVFGDVALGVAIWTIHIYLRPMHDALKAIWVTGAAGSVVVAALSGGIVSTTVVDSRALLGVGWTFVALTGLSFKEAFCFRRAAALGLAILTPVLSAGHFLHLISPVAALPLLKAESIAMLYFSFEKFQMPTSMDIGDKSVFEYLARQEQT